MTPAAKPTRSNPFAPLKERTFRRIWSASLLGNLGQLVLGVGAAWEMTRLTNSPAMVALVQTAMMLPIMLASLPAGAMADMYDRRKLAMGGLSISILSASVLAVLATFGLAGPWVLLGFCFLIGVGVAVYSPAWSSSINEQVSPQMLPSAVALGTISSSAARSIGPAVGGLIVLALGAKVSFALNALLYIPMLIAFFLWKRRQSKPRLPPEGIGRAILSGSRYALHSPMLKRTLLRIVLFGSTGATSTALAPLIAKDMLGGDASTYGILLGASGTGAVIGSLFVAGLRERFGTENTVRVLMLASGAALVLVGISTNLLLTCAALVVLGGANILTIALHNVSVQLSAPRWVLARALSLYGSALTGGIALGAWFWGMVAGIWSVEDALIASGLLMGLLPLLAMLLPLHEQDSDQILPVPIQSEPEVGLAINMRSGPVIIEIDCQVAPESAREFYNEAIKLRSLRLRNGAYNWSIARDIADPTLWTERFICLTWADFLRIRDRQTAADRAATDAVDQYLLPGTSRHVRRRLERPFGSVRWHPESPDPGSDETGQVNSNYIPH